jgi:ubiquinone/menaquinone biosynthesis C-methylase UbiE
MNVYSPREYWTEISEKFRSADPAGFAPVLHPDAPAWFNRTIDSLQFRAMKRALALASVQPGSRFLDVGCGTGRWVRRYAQLGFRPIGVDATAGMLRTARQNGTTQPLTVGWANGLPFADASFDAVSDVTVIQHIHYSLQPAALEEMLRVLKPEGRLILIEVIRGRDAHIFPRSPAELIRDVCSTGATLVDWFGLEYFFLDRVFVRIAQAMGGRNFKRSSARDPQLQVGSAEISRLRKAFWAFRGLTVPISAWIDPLSDKFCAGRLATHGVFVFRK